LQFRLVVENINNVRAAHIHCAPAGVNGPVGVTLFSGGGLGPTNGILSQGIATAPDATTTCPWTSLADVVNAMRSGNAYVNVHTNDGVDPPTPDLATSQAERSGDRWSWPAPSPSSPLGHR
jgi:hypothetical protein